MCVFCVCEEEGCVYVELISFFLIYFVLLVYSVNPLMQGEISKLQLQAPNTKYAM